jgi:hypothetical protein
VGGGLAVDGLDDHHQLVLAAEVVGDDALADARTDRDRRERGLRVADLAVTQAAKSVCDPVVGESHGSVVESIDPCFSRNSGGLASVLATIIMIVTGEE